MSTELETKAEQEKLVQRASYISGLRKLAFILELNASVPLPTTGRLSSIYWSDTSSPEEKQKELIRQLIAVLPGKLIKRYNDYNQFYLEGQIDGLKVEALVSRGALCRKIVVGKRMVERVVYPPGVAVKKLVEEDEVVWECIPVLGEEAS